MIQIVNDDQIKQGNYRIAISVFDVNGVKITGYLRCKHCSEMYVDQVVLDIDTTLEEVEEHWESVESLPDYNLNIIAEQETIEAYKQSQENPRPDKSSWIDKEYVVGGDIREDKEIFYQVKPGKDHITQELYRPPEPSIWTVYTDPDYPQEWQQGASYAKDAKVVHNGFIWISGVDNNIWEPGGPGVYENIWKNIGLI